jgi:peptide-methionine (R)-S-oxide reductase
MKKIIAVLLLGILTSCTSNSQSKLIENKNYSVTKTETEWKKELTEMEFYVLRKSGTERAFSSPLDKNFKKGIYVCSACKTALYSSEHKFDSGTGWPSFDRAIEQNVAFDDDDNIRYTGTELKCATCGGHLGHSFDDGPKTTGKRHCINGVALQFIPKK